MELRQYWNVIWRWRWLVLAVVGLTAIVSALLFLRTPRSYQTELWFITRQDTMNGTVGQPVDIEGQVLFMFDPFYYRWFGSEFLVDDYTLITESDAFAASTLQIMRDPFFPNKVMEDLNTQAAEQGGPMRSEQDANRLRDAIARLRVADVKNAIESDRKHRELHLVITAPSAELAKAIADAAATVLTDAKLKPVRGQMLDDHAVFAQIGRVGMDNIASSRGRDLLNAAIRVLIGVAVALALAFLLEYLDNSVRDEHDARRVLNLPVLGTIPRS